MNRNVVINASLALAYIGTSGSLILYNATILKGVFPYPALLTTGHMVFSGGLSILLVKLNDAGVQLPLPADFLKLPANMDQTAYRTAIVPIAALQGASLWLSNLAYLFIGVSLIQMIKASNTVWTFLWGVPLGLHEYESSKAMNLAIIGGGVAMAAMGAVDGSVAGMLIQLLGIIVEAARLAMMQLTLQARGLKLSPITALYYIAPAVIPVLLTVAIVKGEIGSLYAAGWKFPFWMMFSNMMLAFSLNFIGILVIKVSGWCGGGLTAVSLFSLSYEFSLLFLPHLLLSNPPPPSSFFPLSFLSTPPTAYVGGGVRSVGHLQRHFAGDLGGGTLGRGGHFSTARGLRHRPRGLGLLQLHGESRGRQGERRRRRRRRRRGGDEDWIGQRRRERRRGGRRRCSAPPGQRHQPRAHLGE
jgi:hypothetical protein